MLAELWGQRTWRDKAISASIFLKVGRLVSRRAESFEFMAASLLAEACSCRRALLQSARAMQLKDRLGDLETPGGRLRVHDRYPSGDGACVSHRRNRRSVRDVLERPPLGFFAKNQNRQRRDHEGTRAE